MKILKKIRKKINYINYDITIIDGVDGIYFTIELDNDEIYDSEDIDMYNNVDDAIQGAINYIYEMLNGDGGV